MPDVLPAPPAIKRQVVALGEKGKFAFLAAAPVVPSYVNARRGKA
jgi:hypothetical protein